MKLNLVRQVYEIDRDQPGRESLEFGEAELIAHSFMKRLRIGVAPAVKIVTQWEARGLDRREWILKQKGRATWGAPSDARIVAVARIRGAVPISWLAEHYGIAQHDREIPGLSIPAPEVQSSWRRIAANPSRPRYATPRESFQSVMQPELRIGGVLFTGKKSPPGAAELYRDFVPPADWTAIREAIRWYSPGMLAIHGARLFLGCSTGHPSNILCDSRAKLYSIDHSNIVKTDASEIDLLFASVRPGSRAWAALQSVANIREDELPEIFGAVAEHYLPRLRRWRLHHQVRT